MLRLDIDSSDVTPPAESRVESVYDRIAGDDDYRRNEKNLRLIQFCVITATITP